MNKIDRRFACEEFVLLGMAHHGYSWAILALPFILGIFAIETCAAVGDDIRDPRFSPDGKAVIFDRCSPADYPEGCRIHVYNIETGVLGYYLPPPGQTWMQAYYADQGDTLTFVTSPVQDRSRSLFSQRDEVFLKSQIAIMNRDGSQMRNVTDVLGYKGMPAFSHSGKKIIFAQSERLRDSGKRVAAYWELWELDLETGKAELFAGNNGFYQMGLSVYYPDDQRVLLNGDTPMLSLLKGPHETFSARLHEYNRRYKRNSVFVVTRGQALEPPLFSEFSSVRYGCLDAKGNVLLIGAALPKEGLRIRRVGLDGQSTNWKYPPIQSDSLTELGCNVSRDGRHFVLSLNDGPMSAKNSKLMLLDTGDGKWREITLPHEVKQLNR